MDVRSTYLVVIVIIVVKSTWSDQSLPEDTMTDSNEELARFKRESFVQSILKHFPFFKHSFDSSENDKENDSEKLDTEKDPERVEFSDDQEKATNDVKLVEGNQMSPSVSEKTTQSQEISTSSSVAKITPSRIISTISSVLHENVSKPVLEATRSIITSKATHSLILPTTSVIYTTTDFQMSTPIVINSSFIQTSTTISTEFSITTNRQQTRALNITPSAYLTQLSKSSHYRLLDFSDMSTKVGLNSRIMPTLQSLNFSSTLTKESSKHENFERIIPTPSSMETVEESTHFAFLQSTKMNSPPQPTEVETASTPEVILHSSSPSSHPMKEGIQTTKDPSIVNQRFTIPVILSSNEDKDVRFFYTNIIIPIISGIIGALLITFGIMMFRCCRRRRLKKIRYFGGKPSSDLVRLDRANLLSESSDDEYYD